MNKLKVAAQELRDHLGRDSRGMLLLDKLMSIANGQRTRCAALEEASAANEGTIKGLREKVASLESELIATKGALESTAARLSAAELRERALIKVQSAESLEEAEPEGDKKLRQILGLLRMVKKRFKNLPAQSSSRSALVVEDFVRTFDVDEFTGLGMVMTLCALVNVPMGLRARHPVAIGESYSEKYQREFCLWFYRSASEVWGGASWKERTYLASSLPAQDTSPIGAGREAHWLRKG